MICHDGVYHKHCKATVHDSYGGVIHDVELLNSVRFGLISYVPGRLTAWAQLISIAVQQHDANWLAFKAGSANRRVLPACTMPMYGAEWPAAGKWQTVCDLLATDAGLL